MCAEGVRGLEGLLKPQQGICQSPPQSHADCQQFPASFSGFCLGHLSLAWTQIGFCNHLSPSWTLWTLKITCHSLALTFTPIPLDPPVLFALLPVYTRGAEWKQACGIVRTDVPPTHVYGTSFIWKLESALHLGRLEIREGIWLFKVTGLLSG